MFNLRILLFTSVIFLVSSLFPNNIFASVRCETQYGGGEICTTTGEVQINKAVFDPANSKYVDNLFVESYRFNADEEILFRLGVKNVGNNTLNTVHVWDNLPSHLEFSNGNMDFYIYNLLSGENRDYYFKAKVKNNLDNDKVTCENNIAYAQTGDFRDDDSAQVCYWRKTFGISVLPPSGPSGTLLLLTLSLLSFSSAIFLKLNKNINFDRK